MAMTVVVDANVTLALALPLPYSSHADRRIDEWRDERAIVAAPRLWNYEVTSGLRRALWHKLITRSQLEEALTLLEALELEMIDPSPALNRGALRWADRLGQSKAYDGHYVTLAEELNAQFWTADERLRNALAEQGAAWAHWIGAA